jgi:hypothetical protein
MEWDAELLVLRRQDGYFVAVFSARGVTKESIENVAWADHSGKPTPEFFGPGSVRQSPRR